MLRKTVSLIGAPTDIGAGVLGTRLGPQALRDAELAHRLQRIGFEVKDLGDIPGPLNPNRRRKGHQIRHHAEVLAWNQAVYAEVEDILARHEMPVLLGGDHSLAMGSISAVANYCHTHGKKLRVLWLDAHADFNHVKSSPSGNSHGMPLACLSGLGPLDLTHLAGFYPAVSVADIRLLGVRSIDPEERLLIEEAKVPLCAMEDIHTMGMEQAMHWALDGLDHDTHLHVSFDLDFLDPSIAPGVGTDEMGGPDYDEAMACMMAIARSGKLGSVDLVELNPRLDVCGLTTFLAVDFLEVMLSGEPLSSHRFETEFSVSA